MLKIVFDKKMESEKYQATSITSLFIIIENVKCSNLVNRCEISSTEIEPQWLCIMSYFNAIILHTTIKLNINITIGTWAPPIIIFWEFYMNQHVIVTNPLEKTLSTLLLSLLVIPFIFLYRYNQFCNLMLTNLHENIIKDFKDIHKHIFFWTNLQICTHTFWLNFIRLTYAKRHSRNFGSPLKMHRQNLWFFSIVHLLKYIVDHNYYSSWNLFEIYEMYKMYLINCWCRSQM